jgi:hypothetical protein
MKVLEYRESQFHEASGQAATDISLTIDETQKRLILAVSSNVSMIERRSAERNARGISKAGFLTSTGATVGRGYELVIEGHGGALPDRLKHSPREVY